MDEVDVGVTISVNRSKLKIRPSAGSSIGLSMPRADTRRLVAGHGRYMDDYTAKGELHAAFLRSPFPHAEFTLGDLSRPCPFRKSHPAWESHRRAESSHDR